MIVEDQRDVIAFLASPSTYAGVSGVGAPGEVERIETHSAIVFLAGPRAWKLKRAVKFDYLDFSTVERRREMCEAEVQLNRRTAPSLYRGVVPVARGHGGGLELNGAGTPVDWLVEMERFDQRDLCDRRAADGMLDPSTIKQLAHVVAKFHAAATGRRDHGGCAAMEWVAAGNATGFVEFGADVFDISACARLTDTTRQVIRAQCQLLDARRSAGLVRQCHGDLHLRNIVLLNGEPTLFDAIEFNDELACIDVFYDFAFLLMDLLARRLPQHANVLFNRYLAESGDLDALPLLPLFLSCRAAIRAKTSATSARMQSDQARQRELQVLARQYLAMATGLLEPCQPLLFAVGGLSGTGKSSVAARLAPDVGCAPGAVVLRSDEIRKELSGVTPLTRLGPESYSASVSARVYGTLLERARRVLQAGHCVIVDATYARLDDRLAIERVAKEANAPFAGVWLEAPADVLVSRVAHRHDDPSDADARVVQMQLAAPFGVMTWAPVDATLPLDVVVERARLQLPSAQASAISNHR